jgi:hypothetical protein
MDTRNPCRGDPQSARSASAGIRMGATDVLSRGCGGQIIARGGNPGNTSIPTFFKLRRSGRISRKRTSRHALVVVGLSGQRRFVPRASTRLTTNLRLSAQEIVLPRGLTHRGRGARVGALGITAVPRKI